MEQLPKIVKERLDLAVRTNEHPDANLLTAFAENALTKRERTHVLEHLASCGECREVVSLAVPETAADASLPSVPRPPAWMSWPMLRWSAVAACVIVVGAAVRLHYQERFSAVSSKEPRSAPIATPSQPSPELYRSSTEKEEAGKKLDLQATGEPKGKLEMRTSAERDFDSRRKAALFDRLEQKNAKVPSTPIPPAASDKEVADEVAQLKKDLPAEKIAEIAAAAAPSSVTDTKPLSRQRDSRSDDSREYLAKSAETVTVTAEAVPAQTAEVSVSKAKAARKSAPSNEASAVGGVAPAGARAANQAVTLPTRSLFAANSRWAISPDGKLQSSIDGGTTWQNVSLPTDVVLQAVASIGQHVWVGGRAGTLFHSSDSGQHWTQIKPSLNGQALSADIIGLQFADTLHGKLITKDQTWLTSDGGESWQIK